MQFIPYNQKYETNLQEMLHSYVDYTPELCDTENNEANIDFVSDFSSSGVYGDFCYILKEDDSPFVLGLIKVNPPTNRGSTFCWYVTALFVRSGCDADSNASYMIQQFCDMIHESGELCANVHPAGTKAIAFWEQNNFNASLERSIFSNCDGQRLMAYCKLI